MPPVVLAATIAAFASITAALVTCTVAFFSARRAGQEQRKLEDARIKAQNELEQLKAELQQEAAATSARRAYEFDALKRLYEEVEPLLFQLYEAASIASNRIRNMSRASRDGDLEAWMSDEGYYFRSTIHALLAPLGIVHILRQRLTFLDLSLDAEIARQYELGRALNRSFSRDHEFAAREPAIAYRPNAQRPAKADIRQGVFAGNLQRAVARLVVTDGDQARVKTFGELSSEWDNPKSGARSDLMPMIAIFQGFTPEARPILWRILVAQLLVHRAIRRRNIEASIDDLVNSVSLSESDLKEFTPRGGPAAMAEALAAGQAFLRESLTVEA